LLFLRHGLLYCPLPPFLKPSLFNTEPAYIIEFGSAHLPMPEHLHTLHRRGLEGESAFHSNAVRYPPHCKASTINALPHLNHHSLEVLQSLFIPFLRFQTNLDCIARGNLRNFGVHFGFNKFSDIHFFSSSQRFPFFKRSGRRFAVRRIA